MPGVQSLGLVGTLSGAQESGKEKRLRSNDQPAFDVHTFSE